MKNFVSIRRAAARRAGKLFRGLATVVVFILAIATAPAAFAGGATAPADARAEGEWGEPFDLGVIAINGALLPTGKVLFWQSSTGGGDRGSAAYLWDTSGTLTDVSIPYEHDVFCGGQTFLADGRVFVAGGVVWGASGSEVGVTHSDFFDPFTETWSPGPEMEFPRWYPDVKEAADGSMYVFGGQASPGILINRTERYDPVTNTFSTLPSSGDIVADIYARTLLLPSGQIFMAGQNQETDLLDLNTNTWSFVDDVNNGRRLNGNAFLLPGLEKVIVIGGGQGPGVDATATTEIIDFSEPTPAWRYSTSMAYPRQYFTSVYLPDGKILVIGGVRQDKFVDPVGPAEMFDPDNETWTVLATAPVAKAHHSTAILLPDGRVWSAGGDGYLPMRKYCQIYSPPYLFRGQRPTITSAPANLGYNRKFSVATPNSRHMAKVALIKLGTATHDGTFDQRYVLLDFGAKNGKLQVTSPVDSAHAPPGYYMLFIVTDGGIPSVASMVLLQ